MNRILYVLATTTVSAVAFSQTFITAAPANSAPTNTFYGGAILNIRNLTSSTLRLTGNISVNVDTTGAGEYHVYTRPGTYVGNTATGAGWTLWGVATVANAAGAANFTPLNLGSSKELAAGATLAFAVFARGANTLSTGEGAIGYVNNGGATYSDGSLQLITGQGKAFGTEADPFVNTGGIPTFNGRSWAGRIQYAPVPEPASLLALALGAFAVLRHGKKTV